MSQLTTAQRVIRNLALNRLDSSTAWPAWANDPNGIPPPPHEAPTADKALFCARRMVDTASIVLDFAREHTDSPRVIEMAADVGRQLDQLYDVLSNLMEQREQGNV